MRKWKTPLTILISAALISWLVWYVSPDDLLRAFSELNWKLLVPATLVMVVGLYLWDAFCLQTVYATDDLRLSYGQMLHLRGSSYLAGAINYELGQVLLAVEVAALHGKNLVWALSRALLLAYHDLLVLVSLGLCGSLLNDSPTAGKIRAFCITVLAVLVVAGLIPLFLSQVQRERLRQTRWGAWLGSWNLRQSAMLIPQRVIYFGILIVYGAVALEICGIYPSHMAVLSTVPLVLVADGLPTAAGLGTRETALQLLLGYYAPRDILAAMSLVWSTGMLVGRILIGLCHLWIPALLSLGSNEGEDTASRASEDQPEA